MRQLIIVTVGVMLLANVVAASWLHRHETCDGVICPYGAKCKECDGHLHCDCLTICNPNDMEINLLCGTDGRTYKNPCKLKVENCKHKTNVTRKHYGPCKDAKYKPDN